MLICEICISTLHINITSRIRKNGDFTIVRAQVLSHLMRNVMEQEKTGEGVMEKILST
jgi:hypothetical protein